MSKARIEKQGVKLVLFDYFGKEVFRGANLREADLAGADLREANLAGADLIGADLTWANLIGANLAGANLREVDLIGADLIGANLREVDLIGANLAWANLREANLTGADLREANLAGANLAGANLREVDLREVDLIGAKGLKYASLSFQSFGECNRRINAVEINGKIQYFYGCFKGNEQDLLEYIEKGKQHYKKSRLFALETLKKMLEFSV